MITLNAISTSQAATDFLFMATGLLHEEADLGARAFYPQERQLRVRPAAMRRGCRWCDPLEPTSVFARGDLRQLGLRPGSRRTLTSASFAGGPAGGDAGAGAPAR